MTNEQSQNGVGGAKSMESKEGGFLNAYIYAAQGGGGLKSQSEGAYVLSR